MPSMTNGSAHASGRDSLDGVLEVLRADHRPASGGDPRTPDADYAAAVIRQALFLESAGAGAEHSMQRYLPSSHASLTGWLHAVTPVRADWTQVAAFLLSVPVLALMANGATAAVYAALAALAAGAVLEPALTTKDPGAGS